MTDPIILTRPDAVERLLTLASRTGDWSRFRRRALRWELDADELAAWTEIQGLAYLLDLPFKENTND